MPSISQRVNHNGFLVRWVFLMLVTISALNERFLSEFPGFNIIYSGENLQIDKIKILVSYVNELISLILVYASTYSI